MRSLRRDGRDESPATSPFSERGSVTLDLVLNTSTELFAEYGYSATTMRQLADRAQLPPSAFYYYYRRKYDVLLAIMDVAMSRLEDGAAQVVKQDLDPPAQLHALVVRHVRVHLEHPASARVADGELRALLAADRAAVVARRDLYEQLFRRVLDAGVRAGYFATALEIPVASMAILTMSTSVIDWWRPDGPRSIGETAELLGRFAVGVARRPPVGHRDALCAAVPATD